MDPLLVNETSFSPANPESYSLTEIWPFRAEDNTNNGGSGIRVSNLGRNSSGAVEILVNRDGSAAESTVTDQSGSRGNGGKKRKDSILEMDNCLENLNGKRIKELKPGDENDGSKIEGETRSGTGNNKPAEQSVKPSEPPKQDYIHVRARRGQATDSHSLAERARREKISERMKLLQDLVPGCNKVIGKALVLDEIINYIQSLQHQVEFLSMKLEAVNSRIIPAIEGFSSKNLFDAAGMIFGSQETREYAQGSETEWLHMQLGGNFERAT